MLGGGAAPVQIVGSERARRAWSRVLARRSVRATPSDDSPTAASHDGGESPTETQEVPASSLPPPPTVATASCRLKPGPGRERVLEPVCSEGVLQLLDELGFTPPKVSAIPAHQLDGGFPLRHRARPLPRRGCLPPTPAGRTPPGRGSPWVLSASRLM